MNSWIFAAGSLGAFLTAAKAHGRQVRLERELAGVWKVVFGGSNPAAVEAVWRKDRIIFWSVLALSLMASTAYGWVAARLQWKLPASLAVLPAGIVFGFAVVWSFILAFTVAGMAAALRTWMAVRAGKTQGAEWMSKALGGSVGWWGLLYGAAALLLWVSRAPSVP